MEGPLWHPAKPSAGTHNSVVDRCAADHASRPWPRHEKSKLFRPKICRARVTAAASCEHPQNDGTVEQSEHDVSQARFGSPGRAAHHDLPCPSDARRPPATRSDAATGRLSISKWPMRYRPAGRPREHRRQRQVSGKSGRAGRSARDQAADREPSAAGPTRQEGYRALYVIYYSPVVAAPGTARWLRQQEGGAHPVSYNDQGRDSRGRNPNGQGGCDGISTGRIGRRPGASSLTIGKGGKAHTKHPSPFPPGNNARVAMRERLGRRPPQLNGFFAFLMGKAHRCAEPHRGRQSVSEMLDGQCCKYQGNQQRHDGGAEREPYEHVDSKVSPASRQFVSTLNCDLEIGSACNRLGNSCRTGFCFLWAAFP